ncbi:MAG: zf-HC2 domain-containing protein [Lachnospiraceae bacterium]|nr:zf-HC2 domain-containing protein [Lachnospiraceae bacterium]
MSQNPTPQCDIVQDLLPLYAEDMVSDNSKKMIEEHLPGCEACTEVYERLKAPAPQLDLHKDEAESLKKFEKKRKMRLGWKIALIVIGAVIVQNLLLFGLVFLFSAGSKVEDDENVNNYGRYMGEDAEDKYRNKWGMDESIFPEKITKDMEVVSYRMTYYNPWDAQFLSHLTVRYSDEDYEKELARLEAYPSTAYKGYYGVTGFADEENPLAMFADSYQGFVYAMKTPAEDGSAEENTITYVMIIFCNYFMDLKYEKYIPARYLPQGFDAHSGNAYEESVREDKGL